MALVSVEQIKQLIPKRSKSWFGTLDLLPRNVYFTTQNPGEYVCIKVRSHVFTTIGWLTKGFIGVFVPIAIYLFINLLKSFTQETGALKILVDIAIRFETILNGVPHNLLYTFIIVYYSASFTYLFTNFVNWYFNIYLVTNERLISFKFKALSGKQVSEAPLSNIEDITQNVVGVFPSIFNYGNVRVQTAATKGKFLLKAVPNPAWFTDVLADLTKLAKKHR